MLDVCLQTSRAKIVRRVPISVVQLRKTRPVQSVSHRQVRFSTPSSRDRESMEHLASRNNRPQSDKIMPNRLKSALLASISVE